MRAKSKTGLGWRKFYTTVLKPNLVRLPGARRLARQARFVLSPGFRSELRLQREKPGNLFQPFRHTALNRYPGIFSFVREALAGVAVPRVLSFGCSTGEEVFTLREYLPNAAITGIDINHWNISVCHRRAERLGHSNMEFRLKADAQDEISESYDAVFCMAVFRHGGLSEGNAPGCDHLIRFEDFERTLAEIDRCLKPGGYLSVMHSNFRFCDTEISKNYETVLTLDREQQPSGVPLYGRSNRKLVEAVYNAVVFQKRRIKPG